MLHGRESERARLRALLDDAASGRAGALVLHGIAGMGKSALLEDLATTSGFTVLRAHGLESELPLAFAGLHQLLRPVLGHVDALPAPQAHALAVAFGDEPGPAVDPFLVALATLAVLTDAADARPVVCLVDDAHWLDAASADALLFAARRAEADRLAFVLTVRDGDERSLAADDLPALELRGLDHDDARALLAERLPDHTAAEVSSALLAQTGGNPLALLELPKALSDEQLRGTAPLPTHLHLTERVQRVFLDRCRRLPEHVQTLLLVASADDSGRTAVVASAARALGVVDGALGDAERAGLLVDDGGTVRVRHPLVRTAVYQAATGQERRAAHVALAAALDEPADADRRAWHLAAAADRPDDDLAAALERAGGRAERRGGHDAAAAAFERSAQLTADAASRAVLQLAAARNAWAAGHSARARSLLADARADTEDRIVRADIDRLRGRIEVNVGSATTAHRIFQQAARAVAADDPARALEMAAAAAVLRIHGADSGVVLPPGTLDTTPDPGDGARTAALKRLHTAATLDAQEQWAQAVTALRDGLAAGLGVPDADVVGNLGNTALHLGDDEAHLQCFTAMLAAARDDGAVMVALYALPRLAFTQLLTGDWRATRATASEALALSRSTGLEALTAAPLAWLTLLAALQGRPEYEQHLADADAALAGRELGILSHPVQDLVRWAQAVRAGHAGAVAEALHHLRALRAPAIARMAAFDRIDAAVRAGDRDQGVAWTEELDGFARATQWPWALAAADHAQALLADPGDAPALFERALSRHGERPYDRARTELAYGELLRRSHRRTDARAHLRAALTTFEDLGAEPLVARARDELRASGETARKRDASTLTALTPMELQVARLVQQGLSNKDVAAQLWISPRTVAFHLRGVFAKAGVSSRGEMSQLDLA